MRKELMFSFQVIVEDEVFDMPKVPFCCNLELCMFVEFRCNIDTYFVG